MWKAGEFFCMNMSKMGDYQKQAQDAMKNMPDLEKMLQNIPDPAAREKAMKALKDAQKGGMPAFPGQPAAVDNLKITKTGKTRTVDGEVQTQVRFTEGSERGIAWVSKKHMGLAKVAQAISEDMKKTFGDMAGGDIRGQIKDGFPVEIRTFQQKSADRNHKIALIFFKSIVFGIQSLLIFLSNGIFNRKRIFSSGVPSRKSKPYFTFLGSS
jgi:hypothetical protein